jgi:UPF0755 protein
MTYEPTPEPSPLTRGAKVLIAIALVVIAGFVVVGGGSYLGRMVGSVFGSESEAQGTVDVEPGLEVVVDIPSGSTAEDIGAILAAQGVVSSALEFEVAVRATDSAAQLKAGTYRLTTLMNPDEVVAMLVVGPVADVYRVTVVEGLRVEETLDRLATASGHEVSEYEDALTSGEVTSTLLQTDEPTLQDWEGLLFPDTYEFTRSAEPADILQRMATTMEQRVGGIDWTDLEDLGFTPYEGVIIASLIEAETLLDEERPIVSSVIANRLEIGMKLDIDATVLYAQGTRDVSLFDREFDSPYNTYLVAGLPPTPIAAPSRASLEAAANPDDTPYLFYVLADLDGHHAFAETLEEHNQNINQAREDGVLP